jgi:hypothetical protein
MGEEKMTHYDEQRENLTPQQRASQRQAEKRKGTPQVSFRLTPEEHEVYMHAVEIAGGHKAAVMAGINLYLDI